MQRVAVTTGRYVRWVLLACTLLGVAAMHTLGHLGDGHGSGTSTPSTVVIAAVTPVAGHCAGGDCLGRHRQDGHDVPDWSVCLAIVAGLGVAALLAWMLLASVGGPRGGSPWVHRSGPWAARAPPVRWVGLTLATTSVLRT